MCACSSFYPRCIAILRRAAHVSANREAMQMASSWAEFCEQTNPGVLSEARGARPFQNAWRVQESISAAAEKRALVWMAERAPAWINSDHLTLLGFLAQILAGVGYALSRWNRYWLIAVIGFRALKWLGDSRDGPLARFAH